MKAYKGALTCILCGIFLLLTGILCGKSFAAQNIAANGEIGTGKAVLTVRSNSGGQGVLTPDLDINNVDKLAGILKTTVITYSAHAAEEQISVEVNGTSYKADVTGTNYMLPRFETLSLIAGCFFTEAMEEEGYPAVVIDNEFAWKAFESENVVGKTIQINNHDFKITGVFKKDVSLAGSLLDDGLLHVYIPGQKLLDYDATAKIASIQIRTADTGTMDQNRGQIVDALEKVGKNASGYHITDLNISQALLEQKSDLMVFAAGFCLIMTLLSFFIRSLIFFIGAVRQECQSDYLTNVIRENSGMILITLLKMSGTAIGVAATVFMARFSFYIPPRLIPEELINVGYYVGLIKDGIVDEMANMGYVASYPELYAARIDGITNGLCLAAAVGLVLVCLGVGVSKAVRLNPSVVSIAAGFFLILTTIILSILAKIAGMPFILSFKGILVVWAFIYFQILFSGRKECAIWLKR